MPRFCRKKWTSVGEKDQQCGVGAGKKSSVLPAGSQEKGRVGHGLLGCHSGRPPLSHMWASFSECLEDPAPLLPLQASARGTSSPVPLTTWSACPVQLRRPLGSSSLHLHWTRIQACASAYLPVHRHPHTSRHHSEYPFYTSPSLIPPAGL